MNASSPSSHWVNYDRENAKVRQWDDDVSESAYIKVRKKWTVIACANPLCDFDVFVPHRVFEKLRDGQTSFFCPAGHEQRFSYREITDDDLQKARNQGWDEGYIEGKMEGEVNWERVEQFFSQARRFTDEETWARVDTSVQRALELIAWVEEQKLVVVPANVALPELLDPPALPEPTPAPASFARSYADAMFSPRSLTPEDEETIAALVDPPAAEDAEPEPAPPAPEPEAQKVSHKKMPVCPVCLEKIRHFEGRAKNEAGEVVHASCQEEPAVVD